MSEQRGYQSLTDQVVIQLREAILSGALKPGERVDQSAVAEALEVSPVPVREALRRLEAEGLVEFIPQKGAFISAISFEELQEIYLIRELLEVQVTLDAVPQLRPDDLDRLRELEAQMTEATEQRDPVRLMELNREFHFTIYSASGKRLLLQLISSLWDKSYRYRRIFTNLPDRAPAALAEHRLILAHCLDGNAWAAAEAVRANVRRTTRAVLEQFHAGAGQLDGPSE